MLTSSLDEGKTLSQMFLCTCSTRFARALPQTLPDLTGGLRWAAYPVKPLTFD